MRIPSSPCEETKGYKVLDQKSPYYTKEYSKHTFMTRSKNILADSFDGWLSARTATPDKSCKESEFLNVYAKAPSVQAPSYASSMKVSMVSDCARLRMSPQSRTSGVNHPGSCVLRVWSNGTSQHFERNPGNELIRQKGTYSLITSSFKGITDLRRT